MELHWIRKNPADLGKRGVSDPEHTEVEGLEGSPYLRWKTDFTKNPVTDCLTIEQQPGWSAWSCHWFWGTEFSWNYIFMNIWLGTVSAVQLSQIYDSAILENGVQVR